MGVPACLSWHGEARTPKEVRKNGIQKGLARF